MSIASSFIANSGSGLRYNSSFAIPRNFVLSLVAILYCLSAFIDVNQLEKLSLNFKYFLSKCLLFMERKTCLI